MLPKAVGLRHFIVLTILLGLEDDVAAGGGDVPHHHDRDHRHDELNTTFGMFEISVHDILRQDRHFDFHGGLNSSLWPVKRVAEIDGDIVIGGLQMIHEREDAIICGPVMPQGGLQA